MSRSICGEPASHPHGHLSTACPSADAIGCAHRLDGAVPGWPMAVGAGQITTPRWVDIAAAADRAGVAVARLEPSGQLGPGQTLGWDECVGRVGALECEQPRWVWADTSAVYPKLLRAGVGVRRVTTCVSATRSCPDPATSPTGSAPRTTGVGVRTRSTWTRPSRACLICRSRVVGWPWTRWRGSSASSRRRSPPHRTPAGCVWCWAPSQRVHSSPPSCTHVGLPFDVSAHDAMLTALARPAAVVWWTAGES